ncbi:MAG: thiol peroxidase [Chlamydiae bacterium]|nr:thiol peroxidase [Chlamydiota bacterium]
MSTITLKGKATKTCGSLPPVGSDAPDFSLIDKNLAQKALKDFKGKKTIIYTVPSLDTPTCMLSTKKLSELIKAHADVNLVVVSADLPFAQTRVCGLENLQNVHTLSMMRSKDFASEYGILIIDGPLEGLCARALVAINEKGVVVHTELVEEIASEPSYEKAFSKF